MLHTPVSHEPHLSAPVSTPKAQHTPRHPLFNFLMLLVGVPAAILVCLLMLPFKYLSKG